MDLMQAVDDGMIKVGGYRRWHLFMMTCLGISSYATLSFQILIIIFIGWYPDHHCKVPDGGTLNESIPLVEDSDGNWELDSCHVYENYTISNDTIKCDEFQYDSKGYRTIVTEWNLVCDRDFYSELSQTLLHVGTMVGDITFATLSDRVGRKSVHMGTLIGVAITSTMVGLSNSYLMFVIARVLVMIPTVGAVHSGETMYLELFGSTSRTTSGIILQIYWVASCCILGGLGYLITNWRYLQFVLCAPSLLTFVYIWLLPESAMWVVANGNIEEGEKTLQKIGRWNGLTLTGRILPEALFNTEAKDKDGEKQNHNVKKDTDSAKEVSQSADADITLPDITPEGINEKNVESDADNNARNVNLNKASSDDKSVSRLADGGPLDVPGATIDLIRNPILLKHLLIYSLMWFVEILVYYTLVISIPWLPGNRFVNYMISSIVELPGYLLGLYVVRKSRRMTLSAFHFFVAVFLIALPLVPEKTSGGTDLGAVKISCNMLAKMGNAITFAALVLYGKEIFPTNLRNTAAGIYAGLGSAGNMVAPFLAYMVRIKEWVPYTVQAIICILSGISVLFLCETSGKPLPQTIRDCYRLYDKYDDEYQKTKERNGFINNGFINDEVKNGGIKNSNVKVV